MKSERKYCSSGNWYLRRNTVNKKIERNKWEWLNISEPNQQWAD